ncbi:hypothetical protein ABLE68_16930 [Nocardioides sp. CN2-186]|uniref:hypothetical protein n=1 Tax=Nocardioides tweenelious TaxID=3156607 RepID=UPI0032B5A5D1
MGNDVIDIDIGPSKRSWWRGNADGGPLDGNEIDIECTPGLPMRGMRLTVCIGGEEAETSDWQVYGLTGRWDEGWYAFKYMGALDDDPVDRGGPTSGATP